MDRVIVNVVTYSHELDYIKNGLPPSGRVESLPHRSRERLHVRGHKINEIERTEKAKGRTLTII